MQDIDQESPEVQQSVNEAHELLHRAKTQVSRLEAGSMQEQSHDQVGLAGRDALGFSTLSRYVPIYFESDACFSHSFTL